MSTHSYTHPTVPTVEASARTTITAEQFKQAVELDPAWASKLTEPVEITGFCNMAESKITHLSPLIHFTQSARQKFRPNPSRLWASGAVACFHRCKSLKVAEGTFHGNVEFGESSIERIGKLIIVKPDSNGNAASFRKCESLKVAEGTFPGWVTFTNSGIEKIGKLNITKPNNRGSAASFGGCQSLKVAEGTFPGKVEFTKSGVEKIGKLTIAKPNNRGYAASFWGCQSLKVAEGTFPGFVCFTSSGIETIGRISITTPDNAGEYIQVENSPVAKKTTELRKVFQGMPLDELKAALQKCQDDPVKMVLSSLIGRLLLKNSTQEI